MLSVAITAYDEAMCSVSKRQHRLGLAGGGIRKQRFKWHTQWTIKLRGEDWCSLDLCKDTHKTINRERLRDVEWMGSRCDNHYFVNCMLCISSEEESICFNVDYSSFFLDFVMLCECLLLKLSVLHLVIARKKMFNIRGGDISIALFFLIIFSFYSFWSSSHHPSTLSIKHITF